MKSLVRILKRCCFRLIRSFLFPIFYCNHRLFMRLYIPLLRLNGMKFCGNPRYIGIHVVFDDLSRIEIGEDTTISDDCHFLTHDYSITNAFRSVGVVSKKDIALIRGIKVGRNVFIGKKTIVMPNCKIEDNCIIGAGSVVRGNIPSGSVVLGNPGQVVGRVENLAKKWQNLGQEVIRRD